MDNDRSVFHRLDSIEQQNSTTHTQNEEIINLLISLNAQRNQTQNVYVKPQNSNQQVLSRFLKNSTKEYLWFGSTGAFDKSKMILVKLSGALIIVAIISTIISSSAFKIYSTFTLFENIWAICVYYIFLKSRRVTKKIRDVDLKENSCDVFQQDEYGIWTYLDKEKIRYKWFRRLSYIAVILNIMFIWYMSSGAAEVFATIFELAFMGITIVLNKKRFDFYRKFDNYILFTGKNEGNTETITIVFDIPEMKLVSLDDFKKTNKYVLD